VKISPGCKFCYAARLNQRRGGPDYRVGADTPRLDEAILGQPLRWTRPRRIFVCSMSDLFWDQIPDEWIDRIIAVMARANQHTYQVLTKRPERMRGYLSDDEALARVRYQLRAGDLTSAEAIILTKPWPPAHIWWGTSVEDQAAADRIVELLWTPAAVRWVSVEPLLGSVDCARIDYTERLKAFLVKATKDSHAADSYEPDAAWLNALTGEWFDGWDSGRDGKKLDWVVAGGESGGPTERALVTKSCVRGDCGTWCRCGGTGYAPKADALAWARSLRDQCEAAGVPFFWKQWGGPTATSGGRLLDGREWSEFPTERRA
jgi:protein gp37